METYQNFIRTYDLGNHASILGLLITIAGFIISILKIWKISQRTDELKLAVDKTLNEVYLIDTLKELSGLSERLKELNTRLLSEEAVSLARLIQDIRCDFIIIRESSIESNNRARNATLQKLITNLSRIEENVMEANFSEEGFTNPKRILAATSASKCLDDVHKVLGDHKRKVLEKNGQG